jgi:hypothetical protein
MVELEVVALPLGVEVVGGLASADKLLFLSGEDSPAKSGKVLRNSLYMYSSS